MKKINSISELENLRKTIISNYDASKLCVVICCTGCTAAGSDKVAKAFEQEIELRNLNIAIRKTGCQGFCEKGPLLVLEPSGIFYQKVTAEDVKEIIDETLIKNNVIDRLLYTDTKTGQKVVYEQDVPFYKKQTRPLMANNRKIDPTSIKDYIRIGGYSALVKALSQITPDEIIDEIKKSGLRGRGGAGFFTGRKWESAKKAKSDIKYVICNADEGDPGAFMDRSLLEGNPHSILEGMLIGAYAIGSQEGYIYVRNEYPLAVKQVQIAISQMREYGFLGKNILGSDFNFDIKIMRGGGAFVCGESSALMASIEGKVGEPRAKYIHATEKGLWDKPTVLNNVKTWANIPLIINNGSEWYSKIGTEKSKGTMIFSLVGKINNTGLVEVPMGITLKELIFEIGGGIPNEKKFKAVQTGGPSGGCIPTSLLDLPVDYERLTEAGSMMGSGGMIVMDEDTCMVNIAKYFLAFAQEESCGKCTPCREGIKHMLNILNDISNGKAKENDIDLLEELWKNIKETSLCQLGKSAPNPVLTSIRYFRDEYKTHIKHKKCPAKVCKELIKYSVVSEKCTGCTLCAKNCSVNAITGEKKQSHLIDQSKCTKCGTCFEMCKFNAILVE